MLEEMKLVISIYTSLRITLNILELGIIRYRNRIFVRNFCKESIRIFIVLILVKRVVSEAESLSNFYVTDISGIRNSLINTLHTASFLVFHA